MVLRSSISPAPDCSSLDHLFPLTGAASNPSNTDETLDCGECPSPENVGDASAEVTVESLCSPDDRPWKRLPSERCFVTLRNKDPPLLVFGPVPPLLAGGLLCGKAIPCRAAALGSSAEGLGDEDDSPWEVEGRRLVLYLDGALGGDDGMKESGRGRCGVDFECTRPSCTGFERSLPCRRFRSSEDIEGVSKTVVSRDEVALSDVGSSSCT